MGNKTLLFVPFNKTSLTFGEATVMRSTISTLWLNWTTYETKKKPNINSVGWEGGGVNVRKSQHYNK